MTCSDINDFSTDSPAPDTVRGPPAQAGPPCAPKPAGGRRKAHNRRDCDVEELVEDEATVQYKVTAGELRQFVERYERLEAEKKDIADQAKEVLAEATARGDGG